MRALMICLKQCLNEKPDRFNIGDHNLLIDVHLKMKGEYNFDVNIDIEYQIRFEELFAKYLNVLNTMKSVSMGKRHFKSFEHFDDIDWELVADHRYRLIND